jgi:hypothetical protein
MEKSRSGKYLLPQRWASAGELDLRGPMEAQPQEGTDAGFQATAGRWLILGRRSCVELESELKRQFDVAWVGS